MAKATVMRVQDLKEKKKRKKKPKAESLVKIYEKEFDIFQQRGKWYKYDSLSNFFNNPKKTCIPRKEVNKLVKKKDFSSTEKKIIRQNACPVLKKRKVK
jgi:hypothetical protein